jgi:hypothetical protein
VRLLIARSLLSAVETWFPLLSVRTPAALSPRNIAKFP